jgi:dihydrofolate reductase
MSSTRYSIICAMAKNRAIGIDNQLPWRLPADLAHFKAITLGHPIIMGRNTFESLPGRKPLPGRQSIVMTRDASFAAPEGILVARSLDHALDLADESEEVFFIGGAHIYNQAIDMVDRIYLTEVQTRINGDAWFPEFGDENWIETSREKRKTDEKNAYNMAFVVYDRRY